jgi:hypothetical protein
LLLEKDPTNTFDPNAIKVINKNYEFLGYLKKELAAEITHTSDFIVKVHNPYD